MRKFLMYLFDPVKFLLLVFTILYGYLIKICFGNHIFKYKFNEPIMKFDSKDERTNKVTYFQHETSFNVVISFCIILLLLNAAVYLINRKIIIINNEHFHCIYNSLLLYLEYVFKYNPIALSFLLIMIVFYDKILYFVLFKIYNFMVGIIHYLSFKN